VGASWLRSVARRLPPVARRDEAIAALRRKAYDLRAATEALEADTADHAERLRSEFARRPSFQSRIYLERRLRKLAAEIGAPTRSVIRHGKFYVHDLARSHGIDLPVEYGRWEDPRDIPWEELPSLVVIKSNRGTSARGVLPLRRSDTGWRMVGGTESMSSDQLTALLAARVESDLVQPPFLAEEFLDEDGSGSRLPTDVKAYAFYGEVPLVVLRRPGRLGENPALTPFRIIDASGTDMVDFETPSLIDPTLPIPARLAETVEAASRLSVAIRAPFSRLDFYCIGDRVVFGEVTPRPGGSAWHGAVVDELLGDAWDRADVRLARDLADGLPPEPQFGDQ
jgi:hypothetical protein